MDKYDLSHLMPPDDDDILPKIPEVKPPEPPKKEVVVQKHIVVAKPITVSKPIIVSKPTVVSKPVVMSESQVEQNEYGISVTKFKTPRRC